MLLFDLMDRTGPPGVGVGGAWTPPPRGGPLPGFGFRLENYWKWFQMARLGGGSREVPALGRVGLHPGQEFKFSKGEGVQGWKRVGEKESAGWLALLFQINAPNPDWLGPMVEEQSQQPLEAVVQFYGTLLPSSSGGGGSEESGRGWGHACQNGQSFNP